MRVLLIEDNPGDARLICDMLAADSQAHYTIEIADRIARALTSLERNKFDLMLLDLSLPDGEGTDTLQRVQCAVRNVPIIVLTGLNDETVALSAVSQGAQDYLIKGEFDRRLLARVIRYARERHRLVSELESLALMDTLTGLYNRRGLVTIGEEQLKLARRMDLCLALAFIDLDGMKVINDTLGHEAGDRLLAETACLLRSTFRASDVIARLGGDEFVVLANGATVGIAHSLNERLQEALLRHNAQSAPPLQISLSIGFAYYNPMTSPPTSMEQLIKCADQEMYKVKQAHRTSRERHAAKQLPSIRQRAKA